MYREKDIQDCLYGLIGWRQNNNPDYPELSPSLLVSTSGLFVQEDHPLLSIENLDQALKNYDHYSFPAWDNATVYNTNNRVRALDNKVYESLVDGNQGNDPTVSPAEWEEVPLLSQKLEAVTRAAINRVIAAVFVQKKLNEVTKSIFENVQLFDGSGNLLNKEIKLGRFVGLQVVVSDHRSLSVIIKRIGTQFSSPNPEFNLYIWHSSQEDPIDVIEMNLTKINSFAWTPTPAGQDVILKYLSDDYAPGGAFYIGYYEEDLVGQAINRGYDFGVPPSDCATCQGRNWHYYQKWSGFISVIPFEVPAVYLDGIKPSDPGGPKIWDINVNQYQYTKNYGLNLDITVKCDVTDFLCRERTLFAHPVMKQLTVDLLNHIKFSTRNNVIAKEVRDLADIALDKGDNGGPGALTLLSDAIKAVSFDFSDLDESCLPCNQRNGSSWSAF